jgi:hypothetical protein
MLRWLMYVFWYRNILTPRGSEVWFWVGPKGAGFGTSRLYFSNTDFRSEPTIPYLHRAARHSNTWLSLYSKLGLFSWEKKRVEILLDQSGKENIRTRQRWTRKIRKSDKRRSVIGPLQRQYKYTSNCLIWHHAKDVWGREEIAPRILNLGIRGRWMVSFMPRWQIT